NYHTPVSHVPAQFDSSATSFAASAISAAASSVQPDMTKWWSALHDAELDSLVDRAVKANPDVQLALDRLQAARTYEIAVVGAVLPDVEASGAVARGTGSDLSRGRATQRLDSADSASGLQHINVLGGFDAVWEIDLFGQYRREIQAARASFQGRIAERNAVLVAVIADVTRAYIDLRGLQSRAAVLRNAQGILQKSADITHERFNRGITNELDVTLADRELALVRSQLAPVEAAVSAAQYTIATLLGAYPEDLVQELTPAAMVPAVPSTISTGVPLDLLRRRPEIIQAERDLAVATARIGVATANLFPQVSISAAIGYQRQGLGAAPVLGQHIWAAGPGAIWPLLDFGALDAQVEIADLQARSQLITYKRTIQNAVREVDTAARTFSAEQARVQDLADALTASERAVTLATERYDRGLTDFLNVIDAQRQQYDIEAQYTDAQVAVAEQFVALYRSLGGGWQDYQTLPAPYVPQPAVLAMFHRLLSHDRALDDAPQP
ncbi:MAG: efflux transporter outer membrane subunit, partial [Sinobacteraceae bacterium]|nr:efflux transporter outer membrane subunit [Nevskiaceae bacterium]